MPVSSVIFTSLLSVVPVALGAIATTRASAQVACERRAYGTTPDGQLVFAYTLRAPGGKSATVMELGASLTELWAPDSKGALADVVLGFDHLEPYLQRPSFLGATIGRVANRISGSRFTLNGTTYHLAANNGGTNSLHGGFRGFDKRVWQSRARSSAGDGAAVEFSLVSPNGEEGYPGTVRATVVYTLSVEGTLRIDYKATTDRATPLNLTNHTFFNLAGTGSVLDHLLLINAATYTPVDAAKIPTGQISPVGGSAFDFTMAHRIGDRVGRAGPIETGIDHNYVLNGPPGRLNFASRLSDPRSGRVLEVWTTEPGLQVNTGNGFDGHSIRTNGEPIGLHAGCAFETQHFPDSVNQPSFPSVILQPSETFRSTTEFRFSTEARP